MSGIHQHSWTRVVGLIGAAWGAELAFNAESVFGVIAGRAPDHTELLLARVLGVRHLAQAVPQLAVPGTGARLLASVDVIHAASMVALAVLSPRERRVALTSAAAAGALAVMGLGADGRFGS